MSQIPQKYREQLNELAQVVEYGKKRAQRTRTDVGLISLGITIMIFSIISLLKSGPEAMQSYIVLAAAFLVAAILMTVIALFDIAIGVDRYLNMYYDFSIKWYKAQMKVLDLTFMEQSGSAVISIVIFGLLFFGGLFYAFFYNHAAFILIIGFGLEAYFQRQHYKCLARVTKKLSE